MLGLDMTRQVVFPASLVITELTGKSVMSSMLLFPVPLKSSPETEYFLARDTGIASLLRLEVTQPKNKKIIEN